MRDFLIKCGYPAERADMLLGDMKPYHRPEWWVLRRPADLYCLDDQFQSLKTSDIIKGVSEVYFIDRHHLITEKSWRGDSCSSLLLIPYGHYVSPLAYDKFFQWRDEEGNDELLEELERCPPYEPENTYSDQTILLKEFANLGSHARKQRFHWKDNKHNLDEMVWETFESTWEHESGNPTYC